MATPADQIADILKQAIIAALEDRKDELTAIAQAGGAEAGSGLFGDVGSLVGIIGGIIGAVPVVSELIDLPLAPLQAVEDAAGKSGIAFGLGWLLGNVGFTAMEPAQEYLNHAVANIIQSGIFDPQTAASMVSKGIMPLTDASSEASGGNYDGHHFNMMVDAQGNRPTFDVAAEMLRRGLIQETDFETALTRNDVPSYWFEAYKGLMRILLSPSDLALANLRGELPLDQATTYAAQLGVSSDDFNLLIANTGEPPGTEMMMEALRRQFIQPDEFTRAVLQSRVRDEWIPTLLKLQYSPMSTSDAARAVVENYMPADVGASIAAQNGLEPDHWPYIVESWGRPLSHEQMLTLYYRGEATVDEVTQAFKESDLKDKYAEKAFLLGRRLVPERMIVQMLQHAVINSDTAFVMLHQQGYSDDDIASIINLGLAEHTTTHKALTKADIVAMYEDQLMPRKDAVDRLTALGYSSADANDELDLADFKAKAASLRTLKAGTEAALKAHHLTSDQAIIQLTNAGLDHTQASQLVDQWLQQRGTPTKSLTEAQIIRVVEAQLITWSDASTRLQSLGLSQDDARLLLTSYVGPQP
jgi:hypothetical protein